MVKREVLFLLTLLFSLVSCVFRPEEPFLESTTDIENSSKFEIRMSAAKYSSFLKTTYLNEYVSVYLHTDNDVHEARIKFHGNTTRQDPRKSYTLKVYSKTSPDKIIGNYIISGSSGDDSLLRSHLTGKLYRKSGIITPREWIVDLSFNRDFYGPYNVYENVDEIFFQRRKLEVISLYKSLFVVNHFNPDIMPREGFSKKLPDDSMSYNDIDKLFKVINAGITWENRRDLESLLDMSNCLDYFAVAFASAHWDGIDKNFYLYHNPDTGKFEFIPWDLDLTFEPNRLGTEIPVYHNNLIDQLMEIAPYTNHIYLRIKELYNPTELHQLVDNLGDELRPTYSKSPYVEMLELDLDEELDELRQFIDDMASLVTNL